MTRALLMVLLITTAAAPVRADLRVKSRIDVHAGAELAAFLPPAETVVWIRNSAIRVEQTRGSVTSVLLLRPDGRFVLDPAARTYMRVPELRYPVPVSALNGAPSFRRTGEFTAILGFKAERIEVTMPVTLPIARLPGFPSTPSMTGDLWVADVHRNYAKGLRLALDSTGTPSDLEGLVLRQVVRNDELKIRFEQVVTEVVEAPVDAQLFEVPMEYRAIIAADARPLQP